MANFFFEKKRERNSKCSDANETRHILIKPPMNRLCSVFAAVLGVPSASLDTLTRPRSVILRMTPHIRPAFASSSKTKQQKNPTPALQPMYQRQVCHRVAQFMFGTYSPSARSSNHANGCFSYMSRSCVRCRSSTSSWTLRIRSSPRQSTLSDVSTLSAKVSQDSMSLECQHHCVQPTYIVKFNHDCVCRSAEVVMLLVEIRLFPVP